MEAFGNFEGKNIVKAERSVEKEPTKIFARLTIMRHGEIPRSFENPKLTKEGVAGIYKEAEKIKEASGENEDIFIATSPAERTVQTGDILAESLNVGGGKRRETTLIKPMKLRDVEKAREFFDEIEVERDPERKKLAAMYVDPENIGFDDPEVFEPRTKIKKRASLGLKFAGLFFDGYHKKQPGIKSIPHLISTSHAEVLNPFIKEIFNTDLEKDGGVNYGESLEINIFTSEETQFLGEITFRGETKKITIDKNNGDIKTIIS